MLTWSHAWPPRWNGWMKLHLSEKVGLDLLMVLHWKNPLQSLIEQRSATGLLVEGWIMHKKELFCVQPCLILRLLLKNYNVTLRVRSKMQNISRIFHKEMEQKHNKQLHTEEYSIEYSPHEQQLIYEVISGIFLKYSVR